MTLSWDYVDGLRNAAEKRHVNRWAEEPHPG
jgi:hypothetical protein